MRKFHCLTTSHMLYVPRLRHVERRKCADTAGQESVTDQGSTVPCCIGPGETHRKHEGVPEETACRLDVPRVHRQVWMN